MSLVSVLRDQFVNKDKTVQDEELLDGISIASVLPGPVAVNVVAFIGNKLRGIPGALISMLGVLIPSVALIIGLSYLYFEHGELEYVPAAFAGILPAVCGIIVATAWRMSRKNVKDWKQWTIVGMSGSALILFESFSTTLIIIGGGALLGMVLFRSDNKVKVQVENIKNLNKRWISISIITLFLFIMYVGIEVVYMLFQLPETDRIGMQELYKTMSTMSLALFGGGYVFLPVMQQVIVESMGWLSNQEFVDAIAMSQVTPGPIMISSTVIGYKLYGIGGAIVATVGMFLPPATLMLIVSNFFSSIRNHPMVIAAFRGMRPAVIGMIFVAAYMIAQTTEVYWQSIVIFSVSTALAVFTRAQVVLIILGAAIVGIMVF